MMHFKRLIVLTAIAFLCCSAHGQNTDSLKNVLKATSSSKERGALLYEIGKSYDSKNNDSAIHYLKSAINTATDKDENLLLDCSQLIANIEAEGNNLDTAIRYFETALQYARNLNLKDRQINIITSIGINYAEGGNYYLALDRYKEALSIAQALGDKRYLARVYGSMAGSYTETYDYAAALNTVGNAIKINEEIKDTARLASNYITLGVVLSKQNKFQEALKYELKVDTLFIYLKDTAGIVTNMVHMGIIYKNMGKYAQAIHLYENCLNLTKDDYVRMFVYNNLGTALSVSGNFEAAERSFLTADDINDRVFHSDWFTIQNHFEIIRANLLAHHTDSALYYAKQCELLLGKRKSSPDEYKICMGLLSDAYFAKGDLANAYAYNKRYDILQDSIVHIQQTRNIAEAETRFNVAEKNKEVTVLSQENELQKLGAQKDKIVNRLLLAVLGLGMLMIIIMIRAYRKILKSNVQLNEQKVIIDKQMIQLANADSMKSRFLANVSHELRTPVTLLTGMLEQLQHNIQGGKDNQRINIAFNNSRKLQHMIEEILDLSKLENKQPGLKREKKEINHLLKRIVFAFETLMEKDGLKLIYTDEGMDGIYVDTDTDKFEKVINNLVYNAIKFNKQGGYVQVEAHLSPARNEVVINISDSGKGISQNDLPYIFDRFYQGTSSTNAYAPGAGIGLSLVKEFTTMLGGVVSVSSTVGTGSVFTLKFPVADHAMADDEVVVEQIPLPEEHWDNFKSRPLVLVVEDNEEMQFYLKDILADKVELATAGNGKIALEWLETHQPDLIISDIMMPEMDGREFLSHLKASDTYNKIPVIMLTALAQMEDQLGMLRMGVDDYIVKPFNADELRIRVYNLLNNLSERRVSGEEPAEADDIQPGSKEADEFREKIKVYVEGRIRDANISIYDVATELALSERQLYRLAKTLTGCTPAQLIKEVRLKRAYDILMNGDVNKMQDLVRRVGFDNISYFSRQFLDRFGKRPSEFL